jgi:hypothetical protein
MWWDQGGRMLDWSPHQWAQRPTGPLSLAPWSGAPNPRWLVGPCHTALYKGGGGHKLASRGSSPATRPPPTFPNPIYRERNSDGKLRRRRHFLDRRCPSADRDFASLPSRRSPTWLAVTAAPLPETVYLPSLPSPLSLSLCVPSCITPSYTHSYSTAPG